MVESVRTELISTSLVLYFTYQTLSLVMQYNFKMFATEYGSGVLDGDLLGLLCLQYILEKSFLFAEVLKCAQRWIFVLR